MSIDWRQMKADTKATFYPTGELHMTEKTRVDQPVKEPIGDQSAHGVFDQSAHGVFGGIYSGLAADMNKTDRERFPPGTPAAAFPSVMAAQMAAHGPRLDADHMVVHHQTGVQPTPQDRLEALLLHTRTQAKHGAPISPYILGELDAIVIAGRGGKGTIIRHDFAESMTVGTGDKVHLIHSAEEAIDYIRALHLEVRDRTHWKLAEVAVLNALDSGLESDLSRASAAFAIALAG